MKYEYAGGGASRCDDAQLGVNCINAVAAWCKAMQNGIPLIQGLRQVADAFGADLAAISRVGHETEENFRERVRVVSFDRRTNFSSGLERFCWSSADAVCGKYLATCKPGSTWNARTAEISVSAQLAIALRHRQLLEVVIIPLEHHSNRTDFLELYFPRFESASKIDRIDMIGKTLADAWKTRMLGLLSGNALRKRQPESQKAGPNRADVLAIENPCRLSRAEYRVCMLLSAGLNNANLLDELSIGPATLRTHLRNIYAKTETSCQTELLQLLLSKRQRPIVPGNIGTPRTYVA